MHGISQCPHTQCEGHTSQKGVLPRKTHDVNWAHQNHITGPNEGIWLGQSVELETFRFPVSGSDCGAGAKDE